MAAEKELEDIFLARSTAYEAVKSRLVVGIPNGHSSRLGIFCRCEKCPRDCVSAIRYDHFRDFLELVQSCFEHSGSDSEVLSILWKGGMCASSGMEEGA